MAITRQEAQRLMAASAKASSAAHGTLPGGGASVQDDVELVDRRDMLGIPFRIDSVERGIKTPNGEATLVYVTNLTNGQEVKFWSGRFIENQLDPERDGSISERDLENHAWTCVQGLSQQFDRWIKRGKNGSVKDAPVLLDYYRTAVKDVPRTLAELPEEEDEEEEEDEVEEDEVEEDEVEEGEVQQPVRRTASQQMRTIAKAQNGAAAKLPVSQTSKEIHRSKTTAEIQQKQSIQLVGVGEYLPPVGRPPKGAVRYSRKSGYYLDENNHHIGDQRFRK